MIAVVDSSALVELFTVDQAGINPALMTRLSEVIPHVPDIVDAEVLHALRGLVIGGKISAERAEHARALFADMPKLRFPTHHLADRVWSLRHNLGAYDACFVALAEALGVPLVTCDEKQRDAYGHDARVEVFAPRR